MATLLIGDLARRAGVTPATVRYYESLGLLQPPPRSAAGYRRYAEAAVEEVRFIKKAQALGFSLEEVGEILELSRAGNAPCSRVLELSRRHLQSLEERIGRLVRFRDRLAAEIARWDGRRAPTGRGLCQIILNAEAPPAEASVIDARAPVPGPARRRSRNPRSSGRWTNRRS